MIKINIKVDNPNLIPKKEHESDAGFDLRANSFSVFVDGKLSELTGYNNYTLIPGERVLVGTGVKIELPVGYEAQIRPRSGIALKAGISIVNSPGTIDSGYRNEIGVILINHGHDSIMINKNDRVAQMVINKLPEVELVSSDKLNETDRNENGFGSTGVK